MKAHLGKPVASFSFDPRKTWPFMIMLAVLMVLGFARVLQNGVEGEWGGIFMLIIIPGIALVMVGSELRIKGPVLIIGQEGLIDRRRGPNPIPWEAVQEATIKRRLFSKGIRVVLTDGERYDIELNLLRAQPLEVMKLIQETAHRAVDGETAHR